MYYMNMLPHQIRDAIKKNIPLALPLGVIEYHAEHLPLGVDTHTVVGLLEKIEKEAPEKIIVLPTFYYGTASYAVAGPEQRGTINVDAMHVCKVAEDIFKSLLRTGFRNIHAFIVHQSEGFIQGMPTDLAFRFAGRRVIFDFLEKQEGEGWWGNEKRKSYYEGDNPFDWIQVHPYRTEENSRKYPDDHAGKCETSVMQAMYPAMVDMTHFSDEMWYARDAIDASPEYGKLIIETAAEDMKNVLFGS
jgi:creatinine amidohydrolase/Fe(II)-dependent formamide hydrolase-like protein